MMQSANRRDGAGDAGQGADQRRSVEDGRDLGRVDPRAHRHPASGASSRRGARPVDLASPRRGARACETAEIDPKERRLHHRGDHLARHADAGGRGDGAAEARHHVAVPGVRHVGGLRRLHLRHVDRRLVHQERAVQARARHRRRDPVARGRLDRSQHLRALRRRRRRGGARCPRRRRRRARHHLDAPLRRRHGRAAPQHPGRRLGGADDAPRPSRPSATT